MGKKQSVVARMDSTIIAKKKKILPSVLIALIIEYQTASPSRAPSSVVVKAIAATFLLGLSVLPRLCLCVVVRLFLLPSAWLDAAAEATNNMVMIHLRW
jgi:hypothetical protein